MSNDARVRDGIRKMEKIKHELMDLAEQYPGVFQEYERLVEEYNASVVALKHEMRSVPFEGKSLDFGGGFRIQRRTRKGFDAQALAQICPEIMQEPGVIKAVDTKAVQEAAKLPRYQGFAVNQAWFEHEDTPAAYGPPELKIAL